MKRLTLRVWRRMIQKQLFAYAVPVISVLIGVVFLYKTNSRVPSQASAYPLQQEVRPLREELNITFNMQRTMIDGSAAIDLEIEKEVREIRFSAADMIWDMMSVELTNTNRQGIAVNDIHINESSLSFYRSLRRGADCRDSPPVPPSSRTLFANHPIRQYDAKGLDGMLHKLREGHFWQRAGVRVLPVRIQLRPHMPSHVRRAAREDALLGAYYRSRGVPRSLQHGGCNYSSLWSRIEGLFPRNARW